MEDLYEAKHLGVWVTNPAKTSRNLIYTNYKNTNYEIKIREYTIDDIIFNDHSFGKKKEKEKIVNLPDELFEMEL